MKRDLKPLISKLREDRRCKRLKTLFEELPIYRIDVEALTKEIEDIHKARNIRFLTQASPKFIEAVVDASIHDQSNRSRLAEISMKCYKAENTLLEAIEPLRAYMLMTYAHELGFVRTKDERMNVINMALAPFNKFVAHVSQVRTLANMVIEDIDKGAWSLKLLVNAFQLKVGRGEMTV